MSLVGVLVTCRVMSCVNFCGLLSCFVGFVLLWCALSAWASLEVIVRLRVVAVLLMYCLVVVSSCMIAFVRLTVCVIAFFESEIMMHGYPGGMTSCAMMMARSSAMLMHVCVVPKA